MTSYVRTSYTPDHVGFARFLNSDMMVVAVLKVAEEIKARAEAAAPVGHDRDPHPGRYKASFHIRVHTHGGFRNDRAEAVVYNDSPEAFWLEFGHAGREPEHILAQAAFQAMGRR